MQCTLAIDQSTSATKAILLDDGGRIVDCASLEHRQNYPQAGWVEHNAEEIWHNCLAVCRTIAERARAAQRHIGRISIANQRETIVVFDRDTGRPLRPAIVWQCRRGAALCEAQVRLARDKSMRTKTGLRVDSYFSASKLQWLLREEPAVSARVHRGDALLGTIDTYLIYRLTDGRVFATDHTNACRTLLFNIQLLQWDEELCAWWGVPHDRLAQVRPSEGSFGETTLAGILREPVPIRGVMGDSQAALFAHHCAHAGSAKVTFGTGSSVLLNVGTKLPQDLKGSLATIAWVLGGRPTYALEGIITFSAATLNWLRDQLGILTEISECEALARSAPDSDGVYIVPAFAGLGAPYWHEGARAAILGLSARSDRRHVVRAALESMAYQLRDVLEMMRRESGVRLREIHADGGPAANSLLMQFVADIVGVDLRVSGAGDQSAIGAALMGAQDQQAAWHGGGDTTIYRRVMSPIQAQQRYDGWLRAVAQVLSAA